MPAADRLWLAVAFSGAATLVGCDRPSGDTPVPEVRSARTTTADPGSAPASPPSSPTPAGAASARAATPPGGSGGLAADGGGATAPPENMVVIPAGIFLMGATVALGNPEEKPAHEAIVPRFYLDRTEVTVAAYAKCVAAGGCQPARSSAQFCNAKLADRLDHPINCVDLQQAAAFCAWAGKRLPTEREWEYAASGGAERRRYSWGEEDPTPQRACYDHAGGSCPVSSFEPGAFGLYDMSGNVWEWTASAFAPYPSHPQADAIVPRKLYVYRGGSWSRRFPKWLRNLLRNRYEPHEWSAAIGLRCAQTAMPLACPADTAARDGQCVRVRGDVLCEPHYAHDGTTCLPDVAGEQAKLAGTWPPARNTAAVDLRGLQVPEAGPGAEAVSATVTRSRTPQHDADCQRHWPNTPASYLFKGGDNFPSRKPLLRAAGCVPRDMGWTWTSACCPG